MIKPHDFSKRPEARKRVESYRTLPAEERAEKLREEVRKAEDHILSVTGDPLESNYWESLRDKANAELVFDQLNIRYRALSDLFEMHCGDAEVAAVERQNARMLEYTEQMFERTGRMYRYMLDMPREDRGEEIEVEGSLRYWEDGDVLQTPDDAFYGSDFGRMIPIISGFDSECRGDLPIMDCSHSWNDFPSHSPHSVREVMADNPELSYLRAVLDMGTDAGAVVVVPDAHDAESLGRVLREFAQVNHPRGLFPGDEAHGDGQRCGDDLVDLRFNGLHLFIGRAFVEQVVALALLALDVRVAGARASEHFHHRPVQDVLAGVRRRIFLLVMRVECRFFHILFEQFVSSDLPSAFPGVHIVLQSQRGHEGGR